MSINGKRKDFLKEDLLTIAKHNSIRNPEGIIAEVLDTVSIWLNFANQHGVDKKLAAAIDATLIRAI